MMLIMITTMTMTMTATIMITKTIAHKSMVALMLAGMLCHSVSKVHAQTKGDVVAILKAMSTVPELDPLFQVDLSEGIAMVILKEDEGPSLGDNELERSFSLLTNEDLWGFDRVVKVMTRDEAVRSGVRSDQLTGIGLSIAEDQCNVKVSGLVNDGNKFLQGWVSLVRNGFDWEVKGRSVQVR